MPFATLIYALLYTPGIGLTGWEWFWVAVAGLFDIVHWAAGASQRSQLPAGARLSRHWARDASTGKEDSHAA